MIKPHNKTSIMGGAVLLHGMGLSPFWGNSVINRKYFWLLMNGIKKQNKSLLSIRYVYIPRGIWEYYQMK